MDVLFFWGGGDLFDVSRVDFFSFHIYWQNEEKWNTGFGNKRANNIKTYYLYMLAIIRIRLFFEREREKGNQRDRSNILFRSKPLQGEVPQWEMMALSVPRGVCGLGWQAPSPP